MIVDPVIVCAFDGDATRPSPVDRRRPGTKHTLPVSRTGEPLAIRTAKAYASDHKQILPLFLRSPEVGALSKTYAAARSIRLCVRTRIWTSFTWFTHRRARSAGPSSRLFRENPLSTCHRCP